MIDSELHRPVQVRAVVPYRIWLRYTDGIEGEVDLSHLAGKGVFKSWTDPSFFAQVHIGQGGAICWGDSIEMCPDALYLRLTGMSVEDYMPKLRHSLAGA